MNENLQELHCAYEYGIRQTDKKIKQLKVKAKQLTKQITRLESVNVKVETDRSEDERFTKSKFVSYKKIKEVENGYKENLKNVIEQHYRVMEQLNEEHKQFFKAMLDVNNRLFLERDEENTQLQNILTEQSYRLQTLENMAKRNAAENSTIDKCTSDEVLKDSNLKDTMKLPEHNYESNETFALDMLEYLKDLKENCREIEL